MFFYIKLSCFPCRIAILNNVFSFVKSMRSHKPFNIFNLYIIVSRFYYSEVINIYYSVCLVHLSPLDTKTSVFLTNVNNRHELFRIVLLLIYIYPNQPYQKTLSTVCFNFFDFPTKFQQFIAFFILI